MALDGSIFPPRPSRILSFNWVDMSGTKGYIHHDMIQSREDGTSPFLFLVPKTFSTTFHSGDWVEFDIAGNDNETPSFSLDVTGSIAIGGVLGIHLNFGSDAAIDNMVVKLTIKNGATTVFAATQLLSVAMVADTPISRTSFIDVSQFTAKNGDTLNFQLDFIQTDAGTNTIYLALNPQNTAITPVAGLTFPAGNSRGSFLVPFKLPD